MVKVALCRLAAQGFLPQGAVGRSERGEREADELRGQSGMDGHPPAFQLSVDSLACLSIVDGEAGEGLLGFHKDLVESGGDGLLKPADIVLAELGAQIVHAAADVLLMNLQRRAFIFDAPERVRGFRSGDPVQGDLLFKESEGACAREHVLQHRFQRGGFLSVAYAGSKGEGAYAFQLLQPCVYFPLESLPLSFGGGSREFPGQTFDLEHGVARLQPADAPQFSYYAYGKDYHDVIRRKLAEVTDYMQSTTGCRCRVCVDSAPIRERYWAQEAGIGFVGRNNQLIILGKGSYFFLAEIVTTLEFEPDEPCRLRCADCRRCVDACPACALPGDYAALDARSCLSCLTIEYRNGLDEKVAEKLGKRVYGCDECQKVCPHNRFARPTGVDEFVPASEFLSLTFDSLRQMSGDDFRRIFKGSAVKRAKYAGLMRNVEAALRGMEKKGK